MNGHAWDPNISVWTSALGTTEEWFIRNHTHILDHEDMGMMSRFEIAPASV